MSFSPSSMLCTAVIMTLLPGHHIENSIDGEHCAIWVPVFHHQHHVCDALAPCSGREGVLEGLGGILEPRHELLRESFCHQPCRPQFLGSPHLASAGPSSGPLSKRKQFLRAISPVRKPVKFRRTWSSLQHCREVGVSARCACLKGLLLLPDDPFANCGGTHPRPTPEDWQEQLL